MNLLSICKAKGRRSGEESYYVLSLDQGVKKIHLDDDVKRMLENIRDHAHRFAINKQRKKQEKSSLQSTLLQIPGLGQKRLKSLLLHFGGLALLSQASVDQIANIKGISKALAEKIYNWFQKK